MKWWGKDNNTHRQNQPNSTTHTPAVPSQAPARAQATAGSAGRAGSGALRGRGGESRAGEGGEQPNANEVESAQQAFTEWAVGLTNEREA